MFKIEHHDFHPTGKYAKTHFASTKAIADEVTFNLACRFTGRFEIIEEPGVICGWDPGGMLMLHDEEFSFILKDITLTCFAQHFGYFTERIKKYMPRGNKIEYVKIHSRDYCICISPKEFNELNNLINNPDLLKRAKLACEKRENKVNSFASDRQVLRVVEGLDGEKYKISKDEPDIYKKVLH